MQCLPVLRNVFAAGSGLAFLGPRHHRHPWTRRATGDLVFLLEENLSEIEEEAVRSLLHNRTWAAAKKQQERYVGHIWQAARSSEPSSDQSASQSLSNRHSDSPAVSSWGSASGTEACESSDAGTSSNSSAWLKAALEDKWREIQERDLSREYRVSFLAPAASLAHASSTERCDEKLWMLLSMLKEQYISLICHAWNMSNCWWPMLSLV